MSVRVQIEVTGPAELLAAFRARADALLAEQFGERVAEHHASDRLEYRLLAAQGIPFPPFVTASEECPELVVSVTWQGESGPQRGAARISAGRVVDYTEHAPGEPEAGVQLCIEAARDGAIELAVVLRESGQAQWLGYVLDAERQAYFCCTINDAATELQTTDDVASTWSRRWRSEAQASPTLNTIATPIEADALRTLDQLSRTFVDSWIWFDAEPEVETALERHRFTLYGWRICPANLRSEKMRRAMNQIDAGYRYATLDEQGARVVELLRRCWGDAAGR